MKYIATNEGLRKINELGLSEIEIAKEHKQLYDLEKDKINIGEIVMNWNIRDLIVAPVGQKTAMLFVKGQNIKGSYEDLPEVIYKNNKWIKK